MNLNSQQVAQLRRFQTEVQPIYMTQEEGGALHAAGLIAVDLNQCAPMNSAAYLAQLTATGQQWLANQAVAVPAQTSFEIDSNVPFTAAKRGKAAGKTASIYPFDRLEIGQSFHVCPSASMVEPHKDMVGATSAANKRWSKKTDQFELNADGSQKLTKKGKPVVKMLVERKFVCRKAGADDPKGPGARIFRIPC